MLFNSVSFFITFIIMCLIYYILPSKLRWIVLLLFNCFFYMMIMGDYSIMLLYTGIIVYSMALIIDLSPPKWMKSIFGSCFLLLLIGNLLYFKYYNFIISNLSPIISLKAKSIIAPLGISFYTFQSISYIVDVYKGKIKAEKHIGYFFVYISFFGTILSGPIERASSFLSQLREKKLFSADRMFSAMGLILFGLFKKVIIADSISPYVDKVFNHPYDYTLTPVIFAILLYSVQLYADFSGYSLMAVGFSKVLGFDIVNNFNFPYFSKTVGEFWRRWHISLSSFLRDYVYIPLGGSRVGKARSYMNTIVVFFISGIWHGPSWNFIFWGTLHGIYIVLEKVLGVTKNRALGVVNGIITFILITAAWVFFRADTLRHALHLIKASIIRDPSASANIFSIISYPYLVTAAILIALLFIYEYILFKGWGENKVCKFIANSVMIIMLILLGKATESQFIYFKF